jgi:hypothetical protein
MAAFNKFNSFVAAIANKSMNLGSDTLKVMLSNTLPVASNTVKANITEIAAGSGYSSGGLTVGTITSTQTSGTYKLVASADSTLTASGTVGPFQYAVLYDATSNDLIGWWDRGAALTLASADTWTVDFDQVNGILQIA